MTSLLISRELIDALGWTLVHFVWQGVAVAALLALVLAGMSRRSAAARYAVGGGALAVLEQHRASALAPAASGGSLARRLRRLLPGSREGTSLSRCIAGLIVLGFIAGFTLAGLAIQPSSEAGEARALERDSSTTKDAALQVKSFRIVDPAEAGERQVRQVTEFAFRMLEFMLYAKEGKPKAWAQGRRMEIHGNDATLGQIDVIDYPGNLARVEAYLDSMSYDGVPDVAAMVETETPELRVVSFRVMDAADSGDAAECKRVRDKTMDIYTQLRERMYHGNEQPVLNQGRRIEIHGDDPTLGRIDAVETPANLKRIAQHLRELSQSVPAATLIDKTFFLDPSISHEVYLIAGAGLHGKNASRMLLLKDNIPDVHVLWVRDTTENVAAVERLLKNEDIIARLKDGRLKYRSFRLPVGSATGESPQQRRQVIAQMTKFAYRMLDFILCSQDGPRSPMVDGRALAIHNNDPALGVIDVIDSPENLERVEAYISSIKPSSEEADMIRAYAVPLGDVEEIGGRVYDGLSGDSRRVAYVHGASEESRPQVNGWELDWDVVIHADTLKHLLYVRARKAEVFDRVQQLVDEYNRQQKAQQR